MRELPLIVIVGPTASGKTALAIKLAEEFNGEIICADSRTVYRHMDIGTAKPTSAEQARVPHWALDIVEPGERFTAADFKKYALNKIDEIRSRGHVPFLVGGTGLYVDAVVFDYEFGVDADMLLRQRLDSMSVTDLQNYCIDHNIDMPENRLNKRYIIRAIEQKKINIKRRDNPISTSIIVGIATDPSELRTRISSRTEQLFANGVVEESIMLGKKYGWGNEAMSANVYRVVRSYLDGEVVFERAKEVFTTLDWRLAKRQITWFKRNPHIKWKSLRDAESYLRSILANEH